MKKQLSMTVWAALGVLLLTGSAFAGWWDDVGDAQQVDLEDLIKNPRAWKGKEVTFDCVFHQVSEFYNPYYTRFTSSQYVNFSVWSARQQIWKQEEFVNSHKFCFLEKDNKAFPVVGEVRKFSKLRITGYVQSSFKGIPWIEVRFVEVLDNSLSRDSLRQIILADRAVDAENYDTALKHYASALSMELPTEVVASVERKQGQVYEDLGQDTLARASYHRSLELDPKAEEANDLLAGLDAQALPASERPAKPLKGEPRAVDPERYAPVPKAIPAPIEVTPTEVEPEPAPVAEPEPAEYKPVETAPEPVEVETKPVETKPVEVETKPVKAPDPIEEPTPAPVKEPVPVTPEKAPVEKPEPEKVEAPAKPGEDPEKRPNPNKRMSGPM